LRLLLLIILINFFSLNLFAQNIVVVNIQILIDNNENYKKVIKNIENSQESYFQQFKKEEEKLKKTFTDIEDSKLILNDNELNLKIDNYNDQLSNYSIKIEEFNIHYQNQIILIREVIFNEIMKILEKYALNNNIELILDSTSYLIASNSLDITQIINNELKKTNLNLEYKDFEKN
tara:strand:- start:1340 stop:1867 length:528 start_codon:yes stop_codon:yes gene_type:complete